MNTELNPILLEESFDNWICENLMYELFPASRTYFGHYYEVNRGRVEIKDSGKKGSQRIYQALSEIERVKGIKL